MTDSRFESCILLIRQGDKGGLKEIYTEYCRVIYSVMLSVVKNQSDAEDLTSDFFLRLWEKLSDTYKSGGGHKRWLTVCARNMAADFLRKQGRTELTIDKPQDEDDNLPHTEPVSADNTEETVLGNLTIREALEKLRDDEREIVNLKIYVGLTFKEIAKVIKMPLGTVTWKYRSAINKLSNYVREVSEI